MKKILVLGLATVLITGCSSDGMRTFFNGGFFRCGEHNVRNMSGCPLDAFAYDTPAFSNGDGDLQGTVYKVVDRTTGDSWWLVMMNGKWVVLPINREGTANIRGIGNADTGT